MSHSSDHDLAKIARAYDSPTWWYDIRGFFILTFAYRSTLWSQVAFFYRNMGAQHLECAVGTGTLFNMILMWRTLCRAPKISITAFDYAEPMLVGAHRRFGKRPNMAILQEDIGNMRFADESFDTANVANSVHCFPEIDLAFSELYRVLKPNGKLALNVLIYPRGKTSLADKITNAINAWGMRKGILHTPYSRDDVKARLITAGFIIEQESYHGNVSDIVARKPLTPDAVMAAGLV